MISGHIKKITGQWPAEIPLSPEVTKLAVEKLEPDVDEIAGLHSFPALKVDIQECKDLKAIQAGLDRFPNLDQLNVNTAPTLCSLPENLSGAVSLTRLDLSHVPQLSVTFHEIVRLTNLQRLRLRDCGLHEELPESISILRQLTMLEVSAAPGIHHLPDALSALVELEILDMHECANLSAVPAACANLKQLTFLNLAATAITQVPDILRSLPKLADLTLGDCTVLQQLPSLGKSLTSLTLSGCLSLTSIDAAFAGKLPGLREVCLQDLRSLVRLPESVGPRMAGRTHKSSRIVLTLSGLSSLSEVPPDMLEVPQLADFVAVGCSTLGHIPPLNNPSTSLVRVCITGPHNLAWPSIVNLCKISSLQSLELPRSGKLVKVGNDLSQLTALTGLVLHDCTALRSVTDQISQLMELRLLDLDGCSALVHLTTAVPKNLLAEHFHLDKRATRVTERFKKDAWSKKKGVRRR